MNRNQKIAILIGALVIAALGLFPVWLVDEGIDMVDDAPIWTHHRVSVSGLRWIGSPKMDAEGFTTGTKPDFVATLALQLAALALTVAAVVVLEEKA